MKSRRKNSDRDKLKYNYAKNKKYNNEFKYSKKKKNWLSRKKLLMINKKWNYLNIKMHKLKTIEKNYYQSKLILNYINL